MLSSFQSLLNWVQVEAVVPPPEVQQVASTLLWTKALV